MTSRSLLTLPVFALIACLPALADDFPPGLYRNNTQPIPWGGGCHPIKMEGGTLTATCLNFFGAEQNASLADADKCVAAKHDIWDVNGFLRCVISSSPIGSQNPYTADLVSISSDVKTDKGEVKVFRIDQPRVDVATDEIPSVKFQPGDTVKIRAGGCVQSGGMGSTWHLYVNPAGGGAAQTYYSGTIYIPGIIPLDPGDVTGFKRIGATIGQILPPEPSSLPKTGELAGLNPSDLHLFLGFEDEPGDYGDNGYYSHDNGPGNQCGNVGPAWVEVEVTSRGGSKAQTSPHSEPFDPVWDEANGLDGNWLPLNPLWAAQLGAVPGGLTPIPNFQVVCGQAFGKSDLDIQGRIFQIWNGNIDEAELAAVCTSQAPDLDPNGYSFFDAFGMCAPDPFSGHLNWMNATYQGTIYWDSASGSWPNDNDINLNLVPINDGGLTTLNNGYLGLEFDSEETINNYADPYWQPGTVGTAMNGLPAVITGVLGIDGVHGGYTEIHPVLALAIWTDEKVSGDGVDDTWQFFLRNSGDEGGCSSNQHPWLGLSDGTSGPAWYFLNIPVREFASNPRITSSEVWGSQSGLKGPATVQGTGWTYVGFQLPSPDSAIASVDGHLTIHYTVDKDHLDRANRPVPRDMKRKGHPEETNNWSDIIARVKDPAMQKKVTDFFAANKPVYHTPMPHKSRTEAGSDDLARARASVGKGGRSRATAARPSQARSGTAKSDGRLRQEAEGVLAGRSEVDGTRSGRLESAQMSEES